MHRIHTTTVLKPPKITAILIHLNLVMTRNLRDILQRKIRSHILNRCVSLFCIKVNGMPQQFTVAFVWCKRFIKLLSTLRANTIGRPSKITHNTVTRRITKEWRTDIIKRTILTAKSMHGFDSLRTVLIQSHHRGV